MTIHAVLGATGSTGSAVLRCLLTSSEDITIRIFVRSKAKLLGQFPDLGSNVDIHIFEASLSDSKTLSSCLSDVDVIYSCIATNIATPKVDIAQSAAKATLEALRTLRKDKKGDYRPPLLVMNRSQILNPELPSSVPAFAESIAAFALGTLMKDLKKGCDMYVAAAAEQPSLLLYVFMDPPGLHDPGRKDGTGYEFVKKGKMNPSLNYADLGAAMVDVAERKTEFEGQAVGVSATGEVRESFVVLFGYLVRGLRSRLLPF
jgi:putative NADH-flavin reductase